MKSVLFCRVSSKDQEDEGYSLAAQEKLLREYAARKDHSYAISKIFPIAESASGDKQRQIFSEMLQYLRKNKINILLVEKVDRLTRSLKSAVEINEWINQDGERQVHFVKENVILNKDSRSNEKFIWNIKVSVAQYYTDNLSEEVRKGQNEKLAQGWFPGQARFGYKTIGEKKHKTHIILDTEAYWVRRMFELFDSGQYSLKRLEKKLEEEGLRTRKGMRVGKTNINRYLTDIIYTGQMMWCGKVYDGKHDAIIEKDQFDRVQKLLNRRNAPKYSKHDHLFRSMVTCSVCGRGISWEIQKGSTYGYCKHPKDCLERTGAKEESTELSIFPSLDGLIINNPRVAEILRKGLKERHKEDNTSSEELIKELHGRHERATIRLSNLFDEKMDGNIDQAKYDEAFTRYSADKEMIASAIKQYSEATTFDLEVKSAIYDLSQEGKAVYLRADNEKKRNLISIVYKPLTLRNGKIKFEYNEAFNLMYQIAHGVNSSNLSAMANIEDNIFELIKNSPQQVEKGTVLSNYPVWRRGRDSNPGTR